MLIRSIISDRKMNILRAYNKKVIEFILCNIRNSFIWRRHTRNRYCSSQRYKGRKPTLSDNLECHDVECHMPLSPNIHVATLTPHRPRCGIGSDVGTVIILEVNAGMTRS